MAKVNSLLSKRLQKKEQNASKMEAMARRSAEGQLTSFSGVFSVSELSENEKEALEQILIEYATENSKTGKDLHSLIAITSEVKAITNQAILLHGERIKRAQEILTAYRDGAFSSWLIATYGNRQTPYNFMQYYEFSKTVAPRLRQQIEIMPRQAIYTLASREGPLKKKEAIIENYRGESRQELLTLIRDTFPLDEDDRRKENKGESTLNALKKLHLTLSKQSICFSKNQKKQLTELLEELQALIN